MSLNKENFLNADSEVALKSLIKKRIVIMDGAMGTMLQQEKLDEKDFAGEKRTDIRVDIRGKIEIAKASGIELKGNNELLSITQPDIIKSVHESSISEQVAEIETLEFISKYVGNKRSPMCGNTVSHDRRFLAKYMPDLESYFHYRHIDVSSIKELISRWMNDAQTYEKKGSHRAKDDIKESINELKLYKQMLFD